MWANQHGAVFALTKYELFHLSKSPKNFNIAASINITTTKIKPKTDIRVLGHQIHATLEWCPHENGQTVCTRPWKKISASTCGARFSKARQMYTGVVHPISTYDSAVWHMPKDDSIKKTKTSTNKLTVMQNKCLRTVAGLFKSKGDARKSKRGVQGPLLERKSHQGNK